MSKQDKIISGIILAHSLLGLAWVLWVASHFGFPAQFVIPNLLLVALGVVSGLGWLRQRRWSVPLTIILYLAQLIHVITPQFPWSYSLGFNLSIGLGWFTAGSVGLNLLALFMLLWSTARACAPNNSFKPKPLRGSA